MEIFSICSFQNIWSDGLTERRCSWDTPLPLLLLPPWPSWRTPTSWVRRRLFTLYHKFQIFTIYHFYFLANVFLFLQFGRAQNTET